MRSNVRPVITKEAMLKMSNAMFSALGNSTAKTVGRGAAYGASAGGLGGLIHEFAGMHRAAKLTPAEAATIKANAKALRANLPSGVLSADQAKLLRDADRLEALGGNTGKSLWETMKSDPGGFLTRAAPRFAKSTAAGAAVGGAAGAAGGYAATRYGAHQANKWMLPAAGAAAVGGLALGAAASR